MKENYSFTVNGIVRNTDQDKPLLRYLRDDLHLHSVNDDETGSREKNYYHRRLKR